MKSTKIYTREDIRNLWRRYKHNCDMDAGNDFMLIAYAQGQTLDAFKAEIDRECLEEDTYAVATARPRTTAGQRRRAGVLLWEKAETYKQEQPGLTSQAALKLAISENPTLGEQYTGFRISR